MKKDVTKAWNGKRGEGNKLGENENKYWEQNRELEMKLLKGLGFKSVFVSLFPFPVPGSPFPCFSNIRMKKLYILPRLPLLAN